MNKKRLIMSLITAGFFVSCNQAPTTDTVANEENSIELAVEETEEKAKVDPHQTSFGPKKVDTTKAISTAELLAQFEGETEMEATFKAEINEICSKMGCWINIAKEDGENFMVRFKDHFTIPIDTKPGTTVYLSGKAIQDTVSVDMQKHFLEDANAPQEEIDAITDIKYGMVFIADGIELVR